MYVLFDKHTKDAAVIDPVEAPKLAAVLKELRLTPRMVLTTHSHWDHAGGNSKFVELFPDVDIDVYGGRGDNAQAATKEVADGDVVVVGKHVHVSVLYTPCHTPGHVCFYARGATAAAAAETVAEAEAEAEEEQEGGGSRGVVFTGDTMFVGGCGNFNSGTPLQMREAFEKLSKLPKDTLICCGHEYVALVARVVGGAGAGAGVGAGAAAAAAVVIVATSRIECLQSTRCLVVSVDCLVLVVSTQVHCCQSRIRDLCGTQQREALREGQVGDCSPSQGTSDHTFNIGRGG